MSASDMEFLDMEARRGGGGAGTIVWLIFVCLLVAGLTARCLV